MANKHVKKDDEVVIIAGTERGKRGKVIAVLAEKNRVIVEGVKMIKKHTKRNQANPEDRPPGFIQQFHLPLGVFGELAGNVRDYVPADAGHFLPGGIMIGKLRAVIVDACILAMSNAEEEDRHGKLNQMQKWAAVGLENAQ